MKIDTNVAAVVLMELVSGRLGRRPQITDRNRLHTDRAPRNSVEERERMDAALAKRARKATRRVQS